MTTVLGLFDLQCPKCKSDKSLQVQVTAWADITPDGTETCGDYEWTPKSACACTACGYQDIVHKFHCEEK